jgi:hypothetical protein
VEVSGEVKAVQREVVRARRRAVAARGSNRGGGIALEWSDERA